MKRLLSGMVFFVFIFGLSVAFSAAVHLKNYYEIRDETLAAIEEYHDYFLGILPEEGQASV